MDLSVVIVNWNTRELLAQCLDSLYASLILKDYEVIVVDNASIDGSSPMVHERFPQVQLIENVENVGFARANNQAIRVSAGRYVRCIGRFYEYSPTCRGVWITVVEPGWQFTIFMLASTYLGK
jgi:GT2 family glycosyltransferase